MNQLSLLDKPSKKPTQAERILDLLERAGDKGVSNRTLNAVCFRYSARLKELRDQGYQISTAHIKESLFRFVLHEEPVMWEDAA